MASENISRSKRVIVVLCAMVIFLTYSLIQVTMSNNDRIMHETTFQSESDILVSKLAYSNENKYQPLGEHRETNSTIAIEDVRTESTTVALKLKRKTNERCEKRLPKIILVGSQKSGTSALRDFTNYHPQIAACKSPSEARYFSYYYDDHSLEWYRQQMPCSFSNQITMEKTPGYFYGNISALRIKQMNEQTIILMIFKDPVEVAISIFAMWRAHKVPQVRGKEFEDMVTVLDSDNKVIVNTGSKIIWYCTFILHAQTWVDTFGKEQIYAIDGSAFEESPYEELQKLETFLGLKTFFKKEQFVFSENKKKYCFTIKPKSIRCLSPAKGREHPEVSEEVIALLRTYFKPFNDKISKLLSRSFIWQ